MRTHPLTLLREEKTELGCVEFSKLKLGVPGLMCAAEGGDSEATDRVLDLLRNANIVGINSLAEDCAAWEEEKELDRKEELRRLLNG